MPKPTEQGGTYYPGIDGLRAVAVIAVIAYHLAVPGFGGGLLGVGVFFTLSGFLITSILLSSWSKTGTLELKRFWVRRARRLLPAVVVVLAVVMAWTAIFHPDLLLARGMQAGAALIYVANWQTIFAGESYFERFEGFGPLDHLWSLSVEEQFYVVWPLLLLVVLVALKRSRVTLGLLTAALAAGSFSLLFIVASPGFDNTRAYEGTDTRAGGILVGALLAIAWPGVLAAARILAVRIGIQILGLAGLAVIGWLIATTDDYSMSLYSWGIAALSVATIAVVAAVTVPGGVLGRVLGIAPLRWVGERSYGIYLWHLPVIASIPVEVFQQNPVPWSIAAVATTGVLAELSWRLLEDPIRRHGLRAAFRHQRATGSTAQGSTAAGSTAQGAATISRAWGDRNSVGLGSLPRRQRMSPPAGAIAAFTMGTVALVACSTANPFQSVATGVPMAPTTSGVETLFPTPSRSATPTPAASTPASPTPSKPTVITKNGIAQTSCTATAYIGESTSLGMVDTGILAEPKRLPAQLKSVGVKDVRTDILGARSIVEKYKGQPNAQDAGNSLVKNGFSGCWIMAMGTNEAANQAVGSKVTSVERIAMMMEIANGQPVLWLTVRTTNSRGPYGDRHMAAFSEELAAACQRYPNLRVYDWRAEAAPEWYLNDGIHFNKAGNEQRSQRVAHALAKAFPAGAEPAPGCVVNSGVKA